MTRTLSWRRSKRSTPDNEEAEIDHLDGLTVDFGESWFNLRPSNTEPLLRLNVEAGDKETTEQLRDEVLELIQA